MKSMLVSTRSVATSFLSIILLFARLTGAIEEAFNPKKIAIIGTGYVGLSLGAGLAELDNIVTCVDIDEGKIKMLRAGEIPIYEPHMKEFVQRNAQAGRLLFSTEVEKSIRHNDVIFITVPTPTGPNGQADISAVVAVAKTIGQNLNRYKVICIKSTVPVGTGKLIRGVITKYANSVPFDMVSNPEFVREGAALSDFLKPDRIVIGTNSERAQKVMQEVYSTFVKNGTPFAFMSIESAELTKYAANALLATKVSFINEIAAICDAAGADVVDVAKGIGLDKRIGPRFLNPGPGYGGSCFPKDTQALVHTAKELGITLKIARAALESNEDQKYRIVKKIYGLLGNKTEGKTVALLGLAFKANTDDVRCSPVKTVIEQLLKDGIQIKAYDPQAMKNMRQEFPQIEYCDSAYKAVTGADVMVVITEWKEFAQLDLMKIRSLMKQPLVLDARNILDIDKLKQAGFTFSNVGRVCLAQAA